MTATGSETEDTKRPPWKGLDTSQMPVFIGYDQVERMVASLVERAASWHPDEVVGIARGGVVPAAMAAGILALPLSFLSHDQATGAVGWIGPAAAGQRILLVDDCCSSGITLHHAAAKLRQGGKDCMTLVVVHDPDTIRHLPDLSYPMRDLFRLPWERGEATPTGRAAKASGAIRDPRAEAPFVGLAIDESLLMQIAANLADPTAAARLPHLPPGRGALISGLPETDRDRISAALTSTPYRDFLLECRPVLAPTDGWTLARFKAETATRVGCTHVIDCDAEQAIGISSQAPHLIVTWWSIHAARGWTIGAAAQPEPLDTSRS